MTALLLAAAVPFGFALLLAFALGRSIPIALGAWSMGWLESVRALSRHRKAFETVAGMALILTGPYLLNEYLFLVRY